MKLVVIGSSTGGPSTLRALLNQTRLACALIIVQHMPQFINDSLRQTLETSTGMPCRYPETGQQLAEGTIYLARSGAHFSLTPELRARTSSTTPINYVCPAVDATLLSLKRRPDVDLTGIILTGMGRDGADGVRHLKSLGGHVIAQSPETCVVDGMPRAAIATGAVDQILTIAEIRQHLIQRFGHRRDCFATLTKSASFEKSS